MAKINGMSSKERFLGQKYVSHQGYEFQVIGWKSSSSVTINFEEIDKVKECK